MTYQIDQSGKVEDTAKDTVLAVAGKDIQYAIKIQAKTKRLLQDYFRKQGQPTLFVYKTFAAGLFILLNAYNMKLNQVTIDEEYTGQSKLIEEMLTKLFNAFEIGSRINISFGRIGKESPAHTAANDVAGGKKKEDRRVSFEEIKKTVSYLSPDWLPVGR